MRNKLILLALLLAAVIPAAGQTKTTVTGTLIAPDGTLATSGFVTFKLTPTSAAQLFTVSGTNILAPEISTCNINSSGVLQNSLLTGACQIWGNNLISPAGTAYNITIAPANQTLKVIQGALISGASVDLGSLTTVTPSVPPPPVPATLLSGANVFIGANTFSGGLTSTGSTTLQATSVLSLNNVRFADKFTGADCGAKINAANTDLGTGNGEIWVTQACGTSWTTPVTLSAGHALKFAEPGVYNTTASPGITLSGSNSLIGSGYSTTVFRATAAMANLVVSTNPADRITIRDIALDGNSLATNVLNLTRSPEGPSELRMYRVRINAAASGGFGAILDGNEDGVVDGCLFEGLTTGVFPNSTQIAKALSWKVPTGDGEITGSYIYGATEVSAQNFSVKGGLLDGLRIVTGSASIITIIGTQVAPLPDTKNHIEVGNGATIEHLHIVGAFFPSAASGSIFNSSGAILGNYDIGLTCEDCSFESADNTAIKVFGGSFASKNPSPNQATLILIAPLLNANVTLNAPPTSTAHLITINSQTVGGAGGRISTDGQVVGTFVSNSANPATSGAVELASSDPIQSRNAANTANLNLIKANTFDQVEIGQAGTTTTIDGALTIAGSAQGLTTTQQSGTGSLCMTTNCTLITPIINGVNAQVGTTYTFVAGDEQKLVTFNNPAAVAVSLPAAGTTGFVVGTVFHVKDIGAGTATIMPVAGTIDGATSLTLATNQGADIYSDGSNYSTQKGSGSAVWSSLSPATAPLTLNNAGFSTEFDQTSPIIWKWKNATAATSTVAQSSPVLDLSGNFWNGTASAEDLWSAQNIVNSGTNGASTLTFTHSGSTGLAGVQVPNLTVTGEAILTGGANPVLDYEPAAFTTSQFFDARPAPWQIIRGSTTSPIGNGIPSILIDQVSNGAFTSGADTSSLNSGIKVHHVIAGGLTMNGASAGDFNLEDRVASNVRGTGPAAVHAEAISATATGDVFGMWSQAFDTGLASAIVGIEVDVDGTSASRPVGQTRGINVVGFPGTGTTAGSSGDISNDWGILVQNFGNGILLDPGLPAYAASTRNLIKVRNSSNATGNANTTVLSFEPTQPGPFKNGVDFTNATFSGTGGCCSIVTGDNGLAQFGKIGTVTTAGNNNLAGACAFAAATSCTVTFNNPYVAIPICVVTEQGVGTVAQFGVTTSPTALIINSSVATSATVNYICIAHPN